MIFRWTEDQSWAFYSRLLRIGYQSEAYPEQTILKRGDRVIIVRMNEQFQTEVLVQ